MKIIKKLNKQTGSEGRDGGGESLNRRYLHLATPSVVHCTQTLTHTVLFITGIK